MINLCFAIDKNFIAQLDVALTSIFCNKDKNDELNIYVLTDSINTKIKQRFYQKYKNIQFIEIDTKQFQNYPLVSLSSMSVYYRLILPTLFSQFDKILFLDSDLIVTSSLQDLYEQDITNYSLAAVEDIGIPQYLPKHITKLGLNKYFNAGVLLLNLKKMRNNNFETNFQTYINNHSKDLLFQDQDVLNVLCQNDVLFIDSKFNQQTTPQNQDTKKNIGTIIHYAGKKKPWNSLNFSAKYLLYWKYVKKSSFKLYFVKTILDTFLKNIKLFIKYLIK